eukprot:gene1079-10598_t
MVLGVFEKDAEDSNYFLCRKIFSAYSTPDLISIQQFQAILRKNKKSLLNPLDHKEPNPEDRKKIETSDVFIRSSKIELSDLHKNLVIKLSDELNLNEISCVRLIQAASKNRNRYGNELEASLNLFFEENQNILTSLLSLIQGRDDEKLPKQIRDLVISFTNELISDNLIENLAKSILKLNQMKQSVFIVEQKLQVVQCIFFSCYYVQIKEEGVFELMKVLQRSGISKTDENSKKYTYTLVMSIISSLDTFGKRIDPISGNSENNSLYKSYDFVQKFEKILYNEEWKEKGFQYFICFQWTLSLNSFIEKNKERGIKEGDSLSVSEKQIQNSFNNSKKGFNFIASILDSEIFQDDDYKYFYIGILSEIIVHTIENLQKLVEKMLSNEEEIFRNCSNKQQYSDIQTPTDFEDFLNLISKVYEGSPDLSLMFWNKKNEDLIKFLKVCNEFVISLTSIQKTKIHGSFISLMNLMSSFASNEETSYNVFNSFKDYSIPMISWDYFFTLMQRQRMSTSKQQQDENILESILKLIQNVAQHSPESRKLFLSNPKWNIFGSLFGLLSCQLSSNVMGRIFRVLASFSKSPEIAAPIWAQLESVRILEISGTLNSAGIKYQLEEIESRNQVYDESLGFLELIKSLISQGIPKNLGKEYRIPGFAPYLSFIQQNVFCKFLDRGYKYPEQKWMIASNCLEIFLSILENYEPNPQDFIDKPITIDNKKYIMNKSPGFELMRDLLSKSDLRRILTSIISNGSQELSNQRLSKGGPYYEKAALFCLRCIDTVLIKEDAFKFVSTKNIKQNPIIIVPLNEPSLIIKISSYLSYSFSSEIRLLSIRILYMMNQIEKNLIGIFSAHNNENVLKSLIIDRLVGENIHHIPEYSNIGDEQQEEEEEHSKEILFENEVRSTILDFLLLKNSMTYFLCGLNPNKPELSSETFLNNENCLQVIVELLDSSNILFTHPHLSEKCYQLIYKLSSDPRTSKVVMNYLQRCDFFSKNISKSINSSSTLNFLYQKSYIMKIIALQIYTGTLNEIHRPGVQEIIHLLFRKKSSKNTSEQFRTQMLEILDSIEIPKQSPQTVSISIEDFLDKKSGQYNIKSLHQALLERYSIDKFKNEIDKVLNQAVSWNQFFSTFKGIESAFDGWKQVLEISLLRCYDMIDKDTKERVLYDLANNLLFKLSTELLSHPLETSMSEVVLLIITKFREQRDSISIRLPNDQCLMLLQGILICIQRPNISQNTRANLYTCLLNYFQYTSLNNDQSSSSSSSQQQQDETLTQNSKELEIGNETLLHKYSIISRVCEDAINGKSILRATSFATLDSLFKFDNKKKWSQFMIDNGILNQLLDCLVLLGDDLEEILKKQDISLNPLYIYENILSFFIKVSTDLEQFGLFFKLNKLRFIDFKVENSPGNEIIKMRYNQLMIPIFRLLNSIFTKQRKSKKIAENILYFINSHHKSISNGLKDDHLLYHSSHQHHHHHQYSFQQQEEEEEEKRNYSSLEEMNLEQLKLITSLFYMLSSSDHLNLMKMKLEKLTKYENLLSNNLIKYSKGNQMNHFEICQNILSFYRNITETHHISQTSKILFSSNFEDSNSLKILFILLENNTNELINSLGEKQKIEMSLSRFNDELNLEYSKYITEIKLQKSFKKLIQKINSNICIIEISLLLLWRHLNAFLSFKQDQINNDQFNKSIRLNKIESEKLLKEIFNLNSIFITLSKFNSESIDSNFIHFMVNQIKNFKK